MRVLKNYAIYRIMLKADKQRQYIISSNNGAKKTSKYLAITIAKFPFPVKSITLWGYKCFMIKLNEVCMYGSRSDKWNSLRLVRPAIARLMIAD